MEENFGVEAGADDVAEVVRQGTLGVEYFYGLGGLFGIHGVGAADGQQGQIDIFQVMHFGDEVGVASIIDASVGDVDDEAEPIIFFGVELFIEIIGGNGSYAEAIPIEGLAGWEGPA